MKIAYFSPLTPVKSGISEYSEREVLPYIKDYFEIDLIIDSNYKPSNKFIQENFKILPYTEFENNYDLLVYHMGNNPFHEYMYAMALKYPGLVIFHDPFLHHLQVHMTVAKKDEQGYREIMQYCLGNKGKTTAENALISYIWPHFEYPLVKKLVDSSKGTIVHSKFAREIILKEAKTSLIKQIKMPISISNSIKNSKLREQLKISKDTLVIGSFGHVGFYKRLDVALKAFSEFQKIFPNTVFLIAGAFQTKEFEKEIHSLIKKLKIEKKVIKTGYVDDLFSYVEITDIVVQLRYPTAGETSIITLQIMGLGKPLLVSNVGSFKELPDDSVIKVNIDSLEEKTILSGLQTLSKNNTRSQLGNNAKKYVEFEHDPKKIAYEFYDFVSYMLNNEKMKILQKEISQVPLHSNQKFKKENLHILAEKLYEKMN
jgi:glycosyltransferase involved in cell wall biosynthesis